MRRTEMADALVDHKDHIEAMSKRIEALAKRVAALEKANSERSDSKTSK